VSEPIAGGTLTQDAIERALAGLWNPPPYPLRPLSLPPDPFCPAALFVPGESSADALRYALIATGTPVHPLDADRLAPLQGPAPLTCARLPHPGNPWHWDGRGTWWR